jgi:hypothetical protein
MRKNHHPKRELGESREFSDALQRVKRFMGVNGIYMVQDLSGPSISVTATAKLPLQTELDLMEAATPFSISFNILPPAIVQ